MAALIAKVENYFGADYLKLAKLTFTLIFSGILFSVFIIASA